MVVYFEIFDFVIDGLNEEFRFRIYYVFVTFVGWNEYELF